MNTPINDQPLETLLGAEAFDRYNRVGSTLTRPSDAVASRTDPYGEMADVVPVTIRNAGLLLRQATTALDAAILADKHARQAVTETKRALDLAKDTHARAEHRLRISALQPNGGEE